jgi:hypothetical protein
MFKKYLYLALFLFSAWFFYKGIPLDTFHHHYIILTIIGGVLTTGLLAMALFNFFPAKVEVEGAEKTKDDNFGCFLIAGIVAFFFGYSVFLIFEDSSRIAKEIEEHGVYATGYIVDGSSYKSRKVDMTDVTIQFTSADGEKHTVVHEISAAEFQRYYQFQEVPLVYSKRYPSILEILSSDAAIAKYSKKEIRNLQLKDLLGLLSFKTAGEIKDHLNNVNQKWEAGNDGTPNTYTFTNKFTNIAIKLTINQGLVYVHNTNDPTLFKDELTAMDFQPTELDESNASKGTYFIKDSLVVYKRKERSTNGGGLDVLQRPFHTVIEVSKMK